MRIVEATFTAMCVNPRTCVIQNNSILRYYSHVGLLSVAYSPSLAVQLNNITVLLIFYADNNCCVEFLNEMNE